MKAILVIDVDDKYLGKEISLIKFTDDNAIYCKGELKPLPQEKEEKCYPSNEYIEAFNQGYNQCLEEIAE